MKYINNRIKTGLLMAFSAMMIMSSCNKSPYVPLLDPSPLQQQTPTLATLLDDPTFSIFKAAVVKANLIPLLSATTLRFTMFIPDNNAMTAAGLSAAAIAALPVGTVTAIASYHIIPQVINSSSIPTFFPNFAYPTIYNPAPALSALLRLTTSPSNRNGYWLNNIPIVQLDIPAVNGVAHRIAIASAPPSRYLWDRINTDPDLTIFRAAVLRADSGVALTAPTSLQGALLNIGANLTVFAASNQAYKNLISAFSLGIIPNNAPDGVYTAFLASNNISTQTVKGIVVYQILGLGRAFLNNFPVNPTAYPTLLNGGIPGHPGVTLKVTFTGPTTITSATVQGVGNATASNVAINPTPDPNGTSDQHFINGVLQKINQVLLPQ